MSALDTLLATQQGPNILGTVNQGIQNNNLQQQNQQRNRLLDFQVQGQQQQNKARADAADKERFERLVTQTASLIGDVTDPQEFSQMIANANFLDAEAKQIAIQFGPDGVRRAAAQVSGSRGINQKSAGQREFDSLTSGLNEEDAEKARRIKLRLDAGAVGSSSQTIANQGTSQQVGESQAVIAGLEETAKATAKGRVSLAFKPQIEQAVISARLKAQDRGEAFNSLNQLQAALPNLSKAVEELRDLSTVATSTLGGKAFDSVVKESGFGSTKGATARAKFIAIVSNQVLPLLKPTFGAAFTVPEGDALRATMGDPDATPEAKMAQLDAFIEQKIRDIETKQAQLGQPIQQALPQGITEDDIAETMRANNMTREQVMQRLQ